MLYSAGGVVTNGSCNIGDNTYTKNQVVSGNECKDPTTAAAPAGEGA